MAYTTIDKSSLHFSPTLYVGNGGTKTVTGIPFEPDMTWLKNRSGATDNEIYDKVRGVGYRIYTNTSAGQDDLGSQGLSAWTSDGFTVGNNGAINGNGNNLVSWNWKGNGQGSSNTDGTINSTYTSANTTSGFSIVKYTSGGGSGTVGHGLGSVPKVMFYKPISTSGGWDVYHHSLGISKRLNLHNTATESSGYFQTLPTSSVFTEPNLYSGASVIMYCFAEKQGFSKMGSYTGTASTNGAFVYTGFKPAWVLIKNTAATEAWFLYDNKRGLNGSMKALFPDETAAEGAAADNIDLLSNGFKLRTAGAILNSNANFVYMAFAEAPLVGSNNVPANAR